MRPSPSARARGRKALFIVFSSARCLTSKTKRAYQNLVDRSRSPVALACRRDTFSERSAPQLRLVLDYLHRIRCVGRDEKRWEKQTTTICPCLRVKPRVRAQVADYIKRTGVLNCRSSSRRRSSDSGTNLQISHTVTHPVSGPNQHT